MDPCVIYLVACGISGKSERSVYYTNCRSLAFRLINSCEDSCVFVYYGHCKDGLFFPQHLVARSATYQGV